MVSAVAWAGLPLVLCALAVGLGLLAERTARLELSTALLAPLGACLAVCVVVPVYRLGASWAVAAPLLAILAAAGFALARRELRERLRPGWGALAGLLAYGLYIAPVVLSGEWTWAGYNFVNDTANNMIFAEHVATNGFSDELGEPSTTTAILQATFDSHYPLGAFALLGTLAHVLGIPTEAAYQPFIAMLAALTATSLAVLARRLGATGPWAAGIGLVAAGASLAYDYALTGAVKEIGLVLVLATAAALSREALDSGARAGAVALVGAVFAAGIAIISAAAGAYAALAAVVLVAAVALEPRRPSPKALAVAAVAGAAGFAVAAAPALADALSFLRSTAPAFEGEGGLTGVNSTVVLGFLARALPPYQALGTWLADDFRFPLAGTRWTLTIAAMVLAGALIAAVAWFELRRRRLGALLLLLPAAGTYLIAGPRLAPYAEAKLLVALSPAAVFAAGMGAWYLSRHARWPAAAAAVAVAAGVMASNAFAYHGVRLAPVDRMEAFEDAAGRAPADGLLLLNEWEEFGKYLARDRRINTGSESFSPAPVVLRDPSVPMFARSFDPDEMTLEYVQQFPAILLRRAPDRSRPPANYRLAYANDYYELWRRGAGPRVVEHLPLQSVNRGALAPRCADVRALARRARGGERIAGMPVPEQLVLDVARRPPAGWNENGIPGTVTPGNPGRATGTVRGDGGRYRVWVRGTSGRPLKVIVDGRMVGEAHGVNTPGQWMSAGAVALAAGAHELELFRPGGRLAPGDGYAGEIGPVVLEPVERPEIVTADPAQAEARFCGGRWDWLERVAP